MSSDTSGKPFERAVSDIVRAFDNVTNVTQGDWVEGPYGRRERDVSFEVRQGDRQFRALIECKDFDASSTGPVGIGLVDAFESKCRELKVDFPLMCSNAGFTRQAIAKAQGVGIKAVAALRMGDDRIRFEVYDRTYGRKLTIPKVGFQFRVQSDAQKAELDAALKAGLEVEDFTYQGGLVVRWVAHQLWITLGLLPIVRGDLSITYAFKSPITIDYPGGSFVPVAIEVLAPQISGAWYEREVTIDATNGLYDWLRHRVQLTGKTAQIQIKNASEERWVKRPPDYVLNRAPLLPGEAEMIINYLHCQLHDYLKVPFPPLSQFIEEKNLDPRAVPYSPRNIKSVRKYVQPP